MENNIEKQLWTIFENINKWLEYAEKKNITILTVIGAEVALCKLFENKLNLIFLFQFYFLFLIISFIIALFSFMPKTEVISWFADFFAKQKKRIICYFFLISQTILLTLILTSSKRGMAGQ